MTVMLPSSVEMDRLLKYNLLPTNGFSQLVKILEDATRAQIEVVRCGRQFHTL
jgi:hypothetical protein